MIEVRRPAGTVEMPSREIAVADELESLAWSELQRIVRSFRQALGRGERARVEDYLACARVASRGCLLTELIHEEIAYRIKTGEPVCIASYLEQFPELARDRRAVADLDDAAAGKSLPGWLGRPEDEGQPPTPLQLGRYELRAMIGRGSFGDVHRAWDPAVGREVALKRPRPGWRTFPEDTDRFVREARGAAVLRHPHIVPVYDAGQVDGEPYLISALVEGKNLADELAADRPGFRQAAVWVTSLADALEHAHQCGVIHRDVKPSNILIDARRQALLTDFGLAKLAGADGLPSLDGQVIGTPAYMAPEQARGEKGTIDARTDVYSLGVVLYELLTGVRPFQGSERMLIARIQEEEPTPPHRLDDSIPRDLETICLKCLRKLPSERYSTAAALSEDLSRYQAGQPIRARPISTWERAVRWTRRHPAVTVLVLLCATSAVGLATSWHRQIEAEQDHARSIAWAARRYAEDLGREAEATRRHLYAVEVGRAFDAWEHARAEVARQILSRLQPQPGDGDLRGFEWDYLWRLCNRDLVLRGHQSRITDLAFSPDGRVLASASYDHTVKLWQTADGIELTTFIGHDRAVSDLAFSPDGHDLVSGSFDGSLRRWNVRDLCPAGVLWKGQGAIFSLAMAPDGTHLAFFSTAPNPRTSHSEIQVLDLRSGSVEAYDCLHRSMWSLDYSPDGRLLADAGGVDHKVRIWDTTRRTVQTILSGHDGEPFMAYFSPDGKHLATTSLDSTVRLWDPTSGREFARQSSSPGPSALAFSSDSRIVAFTAGTVIHLWDLAAKTVRRIPTTHLGRIDVLAFSRDHKMLASGGSDGTVRLWEPRTALPLPAPAQHRLETCPTYSSRPELVRLDPAGTFPESVAVSPDGSSIAAATNDGFVRVFDARTGKARMKSRRRSVPVRDLHYLADGRTIAAVLCDTCNFLYDTHEGRERLILGARGQPDRPAWSVTSTHDDRFVIAGFGLQGEPGRIAIWEAASGRLQSVLRGHADYVRAVDVSRDGQVLASGSGDETIRIWDLSSGTELATLGGHRGQVFAVAFAPGGRLLASGSEDQTVRLWDVGEQKEVIVLRDHTAAVHSVCFSPDGTRLASASRDGAIYLWDLATRRKVGSLRGHSERVNQVRFFPDGNTLVSASYDGTIRFWYGEPTDRVSCR